MAESRITVEVVYARADAQIVQLVELPRGATVAQAIAGSGLLARFTEIDLSCQAFGIFGRRVRANDVVEDGDRVEIYRPLLADPRERRRERADKSRNKRS